MKPELEAAQLQAALNALSEKLKFFQGIENEKNLFQSKFEASRQARVDLDNALKETNSLTRQEIDKITKFQQILVQENEHIVNQLTNIKQEHDSVCDKNEKLQVSNELQAAEIETLKLKISELEGYREKYEQSASVMLKSKEQQVLDLHSEMESLA